jgi:hypothetical protein
VGTIYPQTRKHRNGRITAFPVGSTPPRAYQSYQKVTKEMPIVVYKSGQTMDSYTYQAIRGLIKLGGKNGNSGNII